jgi:hypothetical protein
MGSTKATTADAKRPVGANAGGTDETAGRPATPARTAVAGDPRAIAASIARLNERLAAGDPGAEEAVRELYRSGPDLVARALGVDDLGLSALADRLAAAASDDAVVRRVLVLDVARQAERLAGDDPDPVVELLAKLTAVAALHASMIEMRLVAAVPAVADSPRLVETLDRLAERADRRLQRSTRSLAAARRLLGRPEPVQVDVAVEGRVTIEDVAADGSDGDRLAALLGERAGLDVRGVTAGRN